MAPNAPFARSLRLQRLHHHDPERLFIVPLDHSITDGPLTRTHHLDALVGQLASHHVDGIVLHKGSLRHVDPEWFTRTSLIVHLSASTVHAPDPDAKYLVSSVEEACGWARTRSASTSISAPTRSVTRSPTWRRSRRHATAGTYRCWR